MGLLTLVLIAVIVLVIIGIGAGAFFSGLLTGAQKVGSNPVVQNFTEQSKQFVKEAAQNATNKLQNATIGLPK
jgi:flagellar basal body-associated protein FliL